MAAPNYEVVPIPIEKLLIYRTRMERGNPEGRSLLRPAWIFYYYTKNLQQIEAIGFEHEAKRYASYQATRGRGYSRELIVNWQGAKDGTQYSQR